MRSRKRILVLGEVLQPSGYSTVLQGLLPFLEERFDLHVFARTCTAAPAVWSERWTLHPNDIYADVWGIEKVPLLLERLRPDMVWIVYDAALYLVNREALAPFPAVLYCPIDGPRPTPQTVARLADLERLVLFTETARAAVEGAGAERVPAIEILPHGLDAGTFRPLPTSERRAARRELLGREEGFFVLNANRNNRRKRPDLTIQGFAAFARERPDAWLVLHMDPERDLDLREIAATSGIAGRVIWSDRPLPSEDLNRLYNACDVGVNTSAGEGWGLVSFEHAATGAAQIVPRHSACAELWHDAGVFLEPVETSRAPMAFCEYEDVSAAGLAAALGRLYDDPAFRADRARRAFETATASRYRWDRLGEQWCEMFERLT